MIILGISAYYHDSAACLLRDGQLTAFAHEERFTRIKADARLPVNAVSYALREADVTIADVDLIAYYEAPDVKLARQLWAGPPARHPRPRTLLDSQRPYREIRELLGFDGPIQAYAHHQSHAASAFYASGFEEAAVLTVDGVGEWTTTAFAHGTPEGLACRHTIEFPHSLGLLYATITAFLGFKVNDGEYKVMGLAPYGSDLLLPKVRKLCRFGDGAFELDLSFFDFINGTSMYSSKLAELLECSPRRPESPMSQIHMDIARATQLLTQEVLLDMTRELHRRTRSNLLCMAGGVALNCVANGVIERQGPFQQLFVQPAAGDAGGALGAALLADREFCGPRPPQRLSHVHFGPGYTSDDVAARVQATGLPHHDYRGKMDALLDHVVDALQDRQVVGWFQGRMEFGPRALGARSILANPLDPDIRDRLNQVVKKREGFRPFAPSVLAEHVAEHFDLTTPDPFMLRTCKVTSDLALPGVTHVDGSARPQTVNAQTHPRYHALIRRFHQRTGCPLLVNTSFNIRGEPIVCSPEDALFCLAHSGIDLLVLEDIVIHRNDLPPGYADHLSVWRGRPRGRADHLYTFV